MILQVGDTLESGRFEITSRLSGDAYMLKDTWSGHEREATILEDWRSQSHVSPGPWFIWWHDEVTYMFSADGRYFIARMLGDEPMRYIAAGSEGAVKAAWRLLMPGCQERILFPGVKLAS